MDKEKNKCSKHPKYKGRKKPKYECVECLSIYLLLHSQPRAVHKPTKAIPSKKTYNRKKKHKNKEE
jgi:hypothetical protein